MFVSFGFYLAFFSTFAMSTLKIGAMAKSHQKKKHFSSFFSLEMQFKIYSLIIMLINVVLTCKWKGVEFLPIEKFIIMKIEFSIFSIPSWGYFSSRFHLRCDQVIFYFAIVNKSTLRGIILCDYGIVGHWCWLIRNKCR